MENTNQIPKETLAKIKAELPHGALVEIAKTCGYGDQYVSNFLNGTVTINEDNIKIYYATLAFVRDEREKADRIKKQIEFLNELAK